MDQKLEKQLLVDLYRDYVALAAERELSFTEFTDEQLDHMTIGDLRRIVNELRALVRTPR